MDNFKEIQEIYDWFSNTYYSEKYKKFRDLLAIIENEKKLPHSIERFIILYSLPTTNPHVLLVGNNPSWFHENNKKMIDDKNLAEMNLDEVAEKIPKINSYLIHEHVFAKKIRDIFDRINAKHILKNTAGLNRFWIQTGGTMDFLKEYSVKYSLEEEYDKLINLCENGTRKIVQILKPKFVLLFGNYAADTFSTRDYPRTFNKNETTFIKLTHPSNREGGVEKTYEDLYYWIEENNDGYKYFLKG